MPSIPVGGQAPTTFSNIVDAFAKTSDDKNVRFSEAKGLYTSQKGSLTAIKAFFGFTDALQAREHKRGMAFDSMRQAIDREYGQGMADKVFKHMMVEGRDLTKQVTAGDLRAIQGALEQTLTTREMTADGLHLAGQQGILDRQRLDADFTEVTQNQSPAERARHAALDVARQLGVPRDKLDVALLTGEFERLEARGNATASEKQIAVLENYATRAGVTGKIDDLVGSSKMLFGYYAREATNAKLADPTSNPEGSFMRQSQGKAAERASAPVFAGAVSSLVNRLGDYPDTDLQPARTIGRLVDPNTASQEEIETARQSVTETASFIDQGLGRLFGGSDKQSGRDLAGLIGDDGARVFAAMVDAVLNEAQRVGGQFETELSQNTVANAFALRQLNPGIVQLASTLEQPKKAQMLELSAALQFVANGITDQTKFDAAYGDVIAKYFPAMEGFHEALLERGRQLNA